MVKREVLMCLQKQKYSRSFFRCSRSMKSFCIQIIMSPNGSPLRWVLLLFYVFVRFYASCHMHSQGRCLRYWMDTWQRTMLKSHLTFLCLCNWHIRILGLSATMSMSSVPARLCFDHRPMCGWNAIGWFYDLDTLTLWLHISLGCGHSPDMPV